MSVCVFLRCGDLLSGLGQRLEQGFVKELFPEAAFERLDEVALH